MKYSAPSFRRCIAFVAVVFLTSAPFLSAQQPEQKDPIQQALVSPTVIFRYAGEIDLTAQQHIDIMSATEKVLERSMPAQDRVREANQALSKELSAEEIDEEAAFEKLDTLLAAESEVKRLHLKTMIDTNGVLSVEQRKKLFQIHSQQQQKVAQQQQTQQRLQQKFERLRQLMEKRAQAGLASDNIPPRMQVFEELMKQGKHQEAEEHLDETLRIAGGAAPPQNKDKDKGASAAPMPPKKIDDVPVPDAFGAASPEDLRKEIEAMRVADVAWRKIEWKTCLLEGIRASVEENKPIVVWMFIDLPIDDKRC